MNMYMSRPYVGMAQKRKYKCCVCNIKYYDYGHNPYPLSNIGLKERCCDKCNEVYVRSARYALIDKKISLAQFKTSWKTKDFFSVYSKDFIQSSKRNQDV